MSMTPQEVNRLAVRAADAAAKVIQDELNVKTGDAAGLALSDGALVRALEHYIHIELVFKEDPCPNTTA